MRPCIAITCLIIGMTMFACGVVANEVPTAESVLLLCGGVIALALGLLILRHGRT
jgi:hypothetical protein